MNTLGSLLGYVLWVLFDLVNNYGIAIILFTILINFVLLPFNFKSQKGMAQSARLSEKQKELQKKCGKDKQKYNQELAKLYEQEGASPMSGCLYQIVPLVLMFGIWGAVSNPLRNMLHIPAEKINQAIASFNTVPGIGSAFTGRYSEIQFIKIFPIVKEQFNIFNPEEAKKISEFGQSFNFLGMDLLSTPQASGLFSVLGMLPVVYFIIVTTSQFIRQKIQGSSMQQGSGCMKYSLYFMPLMTVWFAWIAPAAFGLYYITSTIVTTGTFAVQYHFYNPIRVSAHQEAARIALREQQESYEKPSNI